MSKSLKNYSKDKAYILSSEVVTSGGMEGCVETDGTVSITSHYGEQIIWQWNNVNIRCVKVNWPDNWPHHPNRGSLTPTFEQYANTSLKPQTTPFSLDITHVIKGNGIYKITWKYRSGCCGVHIFGMELTTTK